MIKPILLLMLMLTSLLSLAQLKGSGTTISKTYNYKDFNQIKFDDLDGKIEVEIGKPYAINITIDDNLAPLLVVEENKKENLLKFFFKGNTNNKRYIEDTRISIKICMPSVEAIHHNGNSELTVTGISGNTFEFENNGNAVSKLYGSATLLTIRNSSNGNVYAEQLIAVEASIVCTGNGNVNANVFNQITAKASGNCSIRNKGKAKFDQNSTKRGNARLLSEK